MSPHHGYELYSLDAGCQRANSNTTSDTVWVSNASSSTTDICSCSTARNGRPRFNATVAVNRYKRDQEELALSVRLRRRAALEEARNAFRSFERRQKRPPQATLWPAFPALKLPRAGLPAAARSHHHPELRRPEGRRTTRRSGRRG